MELYIIGPPPAEMRERGFQKRWQVLRTSIIRTEASNGEKSGYSPMAAGAIVPMEISLQFTTSTAVLHRMT